MKKISFIVPLLMAVALGGCSIPFLSKSVEQVKQTAEEKVAQQEILKNCKYDKAICEYMAAQVSVFSSGLTMTSSTATNGKAATDESITKMDGNGNMDSVSMDNGKETSHMIVMNKTTYMKNYDDGVWLKMTSSDNAEEKPLIDIPTTAEEMKKTMEADEIKMIYTKVGQEACGSMAPGLTCDIYEMYEQGHEDSKTKMWIDTSKHLSRKMEMGLSNGVINTIVYAYGPVTITEPSPVKEFEMPKYNTGNGQMPSEADIEKMMKELPDYGDSAPTEDTSGE